MLPEANGDATHPAIAVNSAAGQTEVVNGIPTNRRHNYTGVGYDETTNPITPSVEDFSADPPPITIFRTLGGTFQRFRTSMTSLKGWADFHSPSDPGFTLGTTSNPKVVVIDGDYTVTGGTTGAGILLVTGNLTLNGNISYDGMFLVVGKGIITRTGGGNGVISGGIYVANIAGAGWKYQYHGDNVWGTPTWDYQRGQDHRISIMCMLQKILPSNASLC